MYPEKGKTQKAFRQTQKANTGYLHGGYFKLHLVKPTGSYTVEVTNRFRGLKFDRVLEELWMEIHDILQEAVIKTFPKNKKCKKGKMIV